MEENKDIQPSSLSGDSDSGLMPVETLIHVIRGQQVMIDRNFSGSIVNEENGEEVELISTYESII